ncbi:MAG: mechanosensitive ion channel family protein [Actinobacteria bacterium]|nr:mechanosensitive ion channel family protein [Actinomycetota bacterium]
MKNQAFDVAQAARPHAKRALAGIVTALVALTAASTLEIANRSLASFGIAAVIVVAGVIAIRAIANAVRSAEDSLGEKRGTPLTFFVQLIGYSVVALMAFSVIGLRIRGLLLGGAVTGVVIGIAAQQTVGNFFAGIVLLVVRPFKLGDYLVMRSGQLGGEYEGVVTEMGLFYVNLATKAGPVALPNSGVLASAIGPGARTPEDEDEHDDKSDETRQDPGPEQGGPRRPV